jgi:glycosyl transferase family 25
MTWQQALNQYYDHIYVLTLERAKERQERMRHTLAGLDYTFFFGADKAHFSVDELKANGTYSETLARQHHRYGKAMSGGQIGCSWSHRNICEDMLANGYHRVLIFEDDILLNTQALPLIPAILGSIPPDCELLYWGYGKQEEPGFATWLKQQWYHIQHAIGLLKWNHTMIRNLYPKKISTHLATAGFHDYTYAFAINRSAAQTLIRLQTPIQYIADNLLAHAITNQHIKACITLPKIFLHDDLPGGRARDSFIQE